MFGRIIGGLVIALAGAACCYYSYQLVSIFGRNARMETNLGGTRNGVVLFGVFLVVLGMLMIFGVVELNDPTNQIPTGYEATVE